MKYLPSLFFLGLLAGCVASPLYTGTYHPRPTNGPVRHGTVPRDANGEPVLSDGTALTPQ